MRSVLVIVLSMVCCCMNAKAQDKDNWKQWSWLMGDWKGEGSGEPGKGSGVFSFKPALDGHVLLRTAHSEYPAMGNRPATIHDDLLYVYLDAGEQPSRAIYFDNEGHTIHYSIGYADNSITLTSDRSPRSPLFRLTYTRLSETEVNTKFEMSQDGEKWMTYVEGKSNRVR